MRALPGRPDVETERALTREEMADDRERRILRATAELVAEHGYLGFTVEELLARARVGQRMVRKLCGDKEGCYLHRADRLRREASAAPR